MIEINLLPVRESLRLAELRRQLAQMLAVLVVSAVAIGFVYSGLQGRIADSQARMQAMRADIEELAPQVEWVKDFRQKKSELEKKLSVIQGLEAARTGPVRVLDELAIHTPERLWLKSLVSRGQELRLSGASMDNDLVAAFLSALGRSPYFQSVDLESAELDKSSDGQLKLVRFQIDALLDSAEEDADASGAEG